jgi:hypothetical protein
MAVEVDQPQAENPVNQCTSPNIARTCPLNHEMNPS